MATYETADGRTVTTTATPTIPPWDRSAAEPGVASVLLGARTLDQLTALLDAWDEDVPAAALAAVDEVGAPGTSLNPGNDAWPVPAVLTRRTGA